MRRDLLRKVFFNNFSNCSKRDDNTISHTGERSEWKWKKPDVSEDGLEHYILGGEGSGCYWSIDTSFYHSANASFYLKQTDPDADRSRRLRLEIHPYTNYISPWKEIYKSGWYYFPSNWNLTATSTDNRFDSFLSLFREVGSGNDYTAALKRRWRGSPYDELWWFIRLTEENSSTDIWTYNVTPFDMNNHRGKWLKIETYVKRHSSNGIIAIWFNDELIAWFEPIQTLCQQNSFYTSFGSIYCDREAGETYPKEVWIDDVVISNGNRETVRDNFLLF